MYAWFKMMGYAGQFSIIKTIFQVKYIMRVFRSRCVLKKLLRGWNLLDLWLCRNSQARRWGEWIRFWRNLWTHLIQVLGSWGSLHTMRNPSVEWINDSPCRWTLSPWWGDMWHEVLKHIIQVPDNRSKSISWKFFKGIWFQSMHSFSTDCLVAESVLIVKIFYLPARSLWP